MKRTFPPPLLAAFVALMLAGCSGVAKQASSADSDASNPPPAGAITVSVSPGNISLRPAGTQSFSATVSGSSNSSVVWQVNGVSGGSATIGTINASGGYIAPNTLPSPNTVTVRAVSAADNSAVGNALVTLLNPAPVLTSIAPQSVTQGNFTLALNGSGFVNGSMVLLSGTPLATTFISSTQLSATGTTNSPGTFAVAVMNPDPGSSVSGARNLLVTAGGTTPPPPSVSCGAMSLGQGASLHGFVPFPADNAWNKDISTAPVDANSTGIINFIGGSIPVHPDFGAGLYQGNSMGIPYQIVGVQQGPVKVGFTAYGSESDPGPMPIPLTAPIEGYPNPGNGDRHVLILDNHDCWLFELYNAYPGSTDWNAGSAAVWDLTANQQRPYGWTSADAAGLPIFPGLLRYDEVASGKIQHALRFTLHSSRAAFVPPASHWAANSTNPMAAPMGMRLRLKAAFDISTFSPANQVILNALKKYGMIMADNGSSMYISGAPDDRWNNDDLHALGNVTASNFEVVQMNPIYTSANLPRGSAPAITSFTASSQSISAGTPVTLSWTATGASYFVVSPDVGAVRGTSVTVSPTQSTAYTLYATNAFGRSTAIVNITVH